ncbi:methylcobalamin:coenzyme M methyltransferase [Limihaloglobus sulfuriphilus]|uniref:Methylcobalamin:coenzyme M methyltransferase n=1 Tax=Limihaloglobus sulfuriphilus TaxID=1851148 RepID=A0A1Q2MCT2_9BACT|nr:uroporphyrinogen decarboxylase family protein [Limihaloglobus sulfuriphilus]AQQ70513.1 methylcobalamin:coenzyme M methyltransferase [Limihaloglobus sulfuriphilus]
MNGKKRVSDVLSLREPDRTPVCLSPWKSTIKKWTSEGFLQPGEDIVKHFDLDIRFHDFINTKGNLEAGEKILEQTCDTQVILNENGATIKRFTDREAGEQYIDYAVKTRKDWENLIKPYLLNIDQRRIPFEAYESKFKTSLEDHVFLFWRGPAPFELMRSLCGHETLLMAMAMDPDWVKDMVITYAEFTVKHLEILFAESGLPDGIFFFEDMGLKEKPFFSPEMYDKIMKPGHKILFDFAHTASVSKKVTVHSCGYVEPLLPGLIEAGMDCLQGLEVKAGMNLNKIFKQYGDKIALFGGLDARILMSNDFDKIKAAAIEHIFPVLKQKGAYILHSDHSEPPQVEYQTAVYIVNDLRKACSQQLDNNLKEER